ncbi:MAG: Gfo/Idh/MocA family oxidoreductase [Thermodesulfobacteriota bacterium]
MLRLGVIGVGHLGRYHAEKYRTLSGVELVGVVDIERSRADEVAGRLGVAACYDHRDLLDRVDAVSVVVPTSEHYRVAGSFLEAGVHVLVEKPITRTLDEARDLIALAHRRGLVLQVGHLERFNPALRTALAYTGPPLFIEAERISPFPARGLDVDVVLDLMIHDIDLALSLVKGEPKWIHAVGVPVLTSQVDIANVRMEFETGCVANLTASRVSAKTQRKIRIFQKDAYIAIDFGRKEVSLARRLPPADSHWPRIETQTLTVPPEDALQLELESFVQAVSTGGRPLVSGEDGRRALSVALRILEDMKARREACPRELLQVE